MRQDFFHDAFHHRLDRKKRSTILRNGKPASQAMSDLQSSITTCCENAGDSIPGVARRPNYQYLQSPNGE
jgi:hypothetical protein